MVLNEPENSFTIKDTAVNQLADRRTRKSKVKTMPFSGFYSQINNATHNR